MADTPTLPERLRTLEQEERDQLESFLRALESQVANPNNHRGDQVKVFGNYGDHKPTCTGF